MSLENPAQRELAQEDPVAFLARYRDGAVIDEVQRVPQILSYLQGMVDEDPRPGRFLLTGSQNLALLDAKTQSLASRTGQLLNLSSLANDCGISHPSIATAATWRSI